MEEAVINYGVISLIPVLVVIICAVITKRSFESLLLGTIVGFLIVEKQNFIPAWLDSFYTVFKDDTVSWLGLFVVLFGALIALFERSGALAGFSIFISKFANSRRKSLLFTWFIAICMFTDDYLHNMAIGPTMKKVTDKYNVSRAKLAYLSNSTAAPLCIIVPLSTWAVFYSGLLADFNLTEGETPFESYLKVLPYLFYGFIALIISFLVANEILPNVWAMKKAEQHVAKQGVKDEVAQAIKTDDAVTTHIEKEHRPTPIYNFLIPMFLLITVTIICDVNIIYGIIAALSSMFVLYLAQKIMTFTQFMETFFTGMQSMMYVIAMVLMTFILKDINLRLGLPDYIITIAQPYINASYLPVGVFIFCSIYAYVTGAFWDMAAVMMPILIPLAININADPYIIAAAIFSASALGSQLCLYGDGVILNSRACEISPVEHSMTSLPYCLLGGVIACVLFIIVG